MFAHLPAILFLCSVTAVFSQLQSRMLVEGDVCYTSLDKNPEWTCKRIKDCPPAVSLLKQRKPPPSDRRCGFKDADPVVCCPPYEIADWSSNEPIPTRISATEAPVVSTTVTTTTSTAAPTTASTAAPTAATTTTTTTTVATTVATSTTSAVPSSTGADLVTKGYDDVVSKAAAKCEEYRQYYRYSYSKVIPVDGVNYTVNFAIGGDGEADSEAKELLHMALLGYGMPPVYLCGGSLISERFVLSAAHCETYRNFGWVRTVQLGDFDSNSQIAAAAPRTYFVARRYVHEGYKPDSLYHDIMLLELHEDVKFNTYVKPVCLYQYHQIPADRGIVSGWGGLSADGPSNHTLEKVELPFISARKCNETFKKNPGLQKMKSGIMDEQICAGAEANKASCKGDSGGPLQIGPFPLWDGVYMQVGIVSFGKDQCGTDGAPGVYTRVSAYISWIEKIVWP